MKKILLSVSCIFLLALALAGCQKETKVTSVRLIETVHSIFYAPQYVALEKNFFADEGLDVSVTVAQGSDKATNAVITNNADIALTGTETAIYIYNEGEANYPIIFSQLTRRAGNFLVARQYDPNFSWTDVKGKSIIGGREASMPELILEYILKKNGVRYINSEEVDIINSLQFNATAGAFVSGTGDYTVEFEPNATSIENQGAGYVVASLGADSGTVPYTVYVASKEYLAANPNIIQKFTNAIYRGQIWVKNHSASEIAAVIQPQFSENTLEELTKMISRYEENDTWNRDSILAEDSFTLVQDILEQGGLLSKRVPYTDMVNTKFASDAVKAIR